MTARRGQVALYLALVLVGITLFVVADVAVYLAVIAKNKAMNAGDASALAVAKGQGELLNAMGVDNIEHLKAALENDEEKCDEIVEQQARRCFLGPLNLMGVASEWAYRNGINDIDEDALQTLREHVVDIRVGYAQDPEQYPEPWEGAWQEYATALEMQLGAGLYAFPDNIDFVDAAGGHLLLNAQFYNAIAGHNWCWFKFNAPGVLDSYDGYKSWGPLPSASDWVRRRRCCNSEIYSLHLVARVGSALDLLGTNIIMKLTGCNIGEIQNSSLITNQFQTWYFYDTTPSGLWRKWWEIDPHGEWQFPVVGSVKREYDIRGCAACCRVFKPFAELLDGDTHENHWTGAAKPFGTEEDEDGEIGVVTALAGFVTPAFSETRLVPWDAVGGRDEERPNLDMVRHIRKHLPIYLEFGPSILPTDCYYCNQLRQWENPIVRSEGRNYLQYNSQNCIRPIPGGTSWGGTPHGH